MARALPRIYFALAVVFNAGVAGICSNQAAAQPYPFTYVNTNANTTSCDSPTTACQLWDFAISRTMDRGSVSCVSEPWPRFSGNQGFTIDRSILMDCKAGSGGTDAGRIVINATGKHVRIRNVSFRDPACNPCIDIVAAASVELENVYVSGSSGAAIRDRRAGPAKLSIRNSVVVDNTGPGIVIAPASGVITAVIENVSVRESSFGLAVGTGGRVMVKRSVFSQNAVAGIESDSGGIIEVSETLVSNNPTGVLASAGSSVTLSSNGINSNNTGISGATRSYGNNRLFANAVSSGTPPTPVGSASSEAGLR